MAEEVRADGVDDDVEVRTEEGEDQRLLGVGVQLLGAPRRGANLAPPRPQRCMEPEDVRALTEQALRTGTMLSRLVGDLLDELPEDAFAGEDQVEVLFEMLIGTLTPVAAAAGVAQVRATTALLGAMSDRVLADLRAALRLAEEDG